jgi:hypothetical protein
MRFFTISLPETIRVSINTEGSVYNTVWFMMVLFCYMVHGVHIVWTFVYKVHVIPEIRGYQTLAVPPKITNKSKPHSEERGVGFRLVSDLKKQ